MSLASPLAPTYHGWVASTMDAALLVEACLNGDLKLVADRPSPSQRANLSKSGNIFIYDVELTEIKQWKDGALWCPSRELGNYRVQRQMQRPMPPYGSCEIHNMTVLARKKEEVRRARQEMGSEMRSLVGILDDNCYSLKEGGLVKKMISFIVQGRRYRLVSYYCLSDLIGRSDSTFHRLTRPIEDPQFKTLKPRGQLMREYSKFVPLSSKENPDTIYTDGLSTCQTALSPAGFEYNQPPQSFFNNSFHRYGLPVNAENPEQFEERDSFLLV